MQVTIAFVLTIFSFSDKKKVLGAFDRRCWDAACCSRMSQVRDYRCGWLAVKWCSAFPLILWLYVEFLDLLFFIVNFLYFQVFHKFHIFTLNWYSQLFQISVFADTLRIFATPHAIRKRRKAVKPMAVGYVKVTDQPWRIICSLYKTLMSKTLLQESSEASLNLKKSALPRRKKNFTIVF